MIKIAKITSVEEKAFNNMDKYYIVDEHGREGYTFAHVQEGQEIDAFWQLDKRGQNQLKKNKSEGGNFSSSNKKEFKADPLKQASIERQVALKEAVNLYNGTLSLGETAHEAEPVSKEVLKIAKAFHVWLVNNPDKEQSNEN